ncbi:MAG: Branched-chain amino acid transport ATP-binding protein LivF [Candidatus Carbobacillus altaicus]|uniref:Branched-chain amino acid transport ATP-binding protein LivF n=1 Tax=Candidatus Carbonibacillus altaicus TaxID=2163959 RepID=A0A2R6Y217_9BACL|nr:MAG: Branched-chain amino acid transport ATP-binding protein LivF [Candidatus Carbobacillus altaicus]
MSELLRLEAVQTYIGQFHILKGVTFEVPRGTVTALLGRNGAGKTTTLRTVMGLLRPSAGRIWFNGTEIHGRPTHVISRLGIGYVPEDMGIFPNLTVAEHMQLAMHAEDAMTRERLAWVLDLFSDLKKAWRKPGGTLSGGQKQMLAIARAYVNRNALLLIDEPSKGLAPVMVAALIDSLNALKGETTVLLVEQNVIMAAQVASHVVIIDDGRTVHHGTMAELAQDEALKRRYLGIA